jgi:hypothetical protein
MIGNRWTLGILFLFCLSIFSLQGCATLNSSVPFKYVPSLTVAEPNEIHLGMERLVDKRPSDDRTATESVSDVDDKVTSTLLSDFRTSRIFASADYPPRQDRDNLIMKGEIKRFYWKYSPSPIIFIPFLGCLIYLGIPAGEAEGIAEISVQMINAKTGAMVAEYNRKDEKKASYTIYNFKVGEAGSELADAFREVSKQIKDSILSDMKAGRFKIP